MVLAAHKRPMRDPAGIRKHPNLYLTVTYSMPSWSSLEVVMLEFLPKEVREGLEAARKKGP